MNRNLKRTVRTLVTLIGAVMLLLGASTAQAGILDGWASVPGQSTTLSPALNPQAEVLNVDEQKVPKGVDATDVQQITYETGVLQNGTPEYGTMVVFEPTEFDGGAFVYAPPTDSVNSIDSPSKAMYYPLLGLSDTDVAKINAALAAGDRVILVNAYGDENPQYAGMYNGVRIDEGVHAYTRLYGEPSSLTMYGFSGGGIDVGRAMAYPNAPPIDVAIVDSGPTNLIGFLNDSSCVQAQPVPGPAYPVCLQGGLGTFGAGRGVIRTMSAEDLAVIDPKVRSSVKLLALGTSYLEAVTPVPKLWTGIVTLAGALVPVAPETLFVRGAYDDPDVQQALSHANVGYGPGARTIVYRGNDSDSFVRMDHQAYPDAAAYRDLGKNVVVITDRGEAFPGHAAMTEGEMISLMNGDVPQGEVQTGEPMEPLSQVGSNLLGGVAVAHAVYGKALNAALPDVLDVADKAIDDTLKVIEPEVPTQGTQVPAASQVETETAGMSPQAEPTTTSNTQKLAAAVELAPAPQAEQAQALLANPLVQDVVDHLPTLPFPLP